MSKLYSFNLRRYLIFYGLLIIIVSMVPLSLIIISKEKEILVNSEISAIRESARQLTHRLHDEEIINKSEQFANMQIILGTSYYDKLDQILGSFIRESAEIKKISIYGVNNARIYSIGSEDAGFELFSDLLMAALNGDVSSRLTRHRQPDFSDNGKLSSMDMLTVYVPIFADEMDAGGSGRVIGVFEIHKDMNPIFSIVKKETVNIYLLLMISIGALVLFLHFVAGKAHSIIEEKNIEIKRTNMELKKAQKIIRDNIDEVIEHKSFHVRYNNNDLLKCWELKNCAQTQCPSYKSDELRCWQVAGTFCGGKAQGLFAQKYGDCKKCDVYNHACNNKINVIGESFNNMMTLLEQKHLELEKLNEKLKHLVDIDPLTQIGNRRSFQKKIESIHLMALRYKKNYSLIVCDIDNFKLYNDTYGHQKGDYVLVSVANTFRSSIRQTDEIFRWGGEEFVIILPEQGLSEALVVAESLRTAVQSIGIEHKNNDHNVVTISCGVASNSALSGSDIGWETLLKHADDALYKAKAEGRNRVYSSENSVLKS